jgi:hypothetical protein
LKQLQAHLKDLEKMDMSLAKPDKALEDLNKIAKTLASDSKIVE